MRIYTVSCIGTQIAYGNGFRCNKALILWTGAGAAPHDLRTQNRGGIGRNREAAITQDGIGSGVQEQGS
jgi:hypothetical protein